MVALSASLLSCSHDEATVAPSAERVAVQFSSNISAGVRATGTTWTAGDCIGIFMTQAGATLAAETISEGVDNTAYATTGNGQFVPAQGAATIYFPISGAVDFYAYYPQQAVADYALALNVYNQDNQEAIDLMYATATGRDKTQPAVQLTFVHQLSSLVLDVQPGDGLTAADLAGLTVKVKGQATTASFHLADGTLTGAAAPADIAMKTVAAGSRYEAILLPTAAQSRELEFNLNNGHDAPFCWTMHGVLEPGTRYHYTTVRLSRTAAQVEGSIQPWTETTDNNENEAR